MAASIRGTVRNSDGRPLAQVKVVATHEPTGSLFAKHTDHEGRFVFENIKAGGPYALTATGEGLASVQNRLTLKTEQAVDCDFTMHPASTSQADGEPHTSA